MLSSEFRHTLDAKNRLFIPAKYREELGISFMVVRSIRDASLKIYSLTEWENYIAPLKALPRKVAEDTFRYLYRNAAQVSPDTQGRILLPQALVEHAAITKGAVVVGCGDYAEIWAEENYDAKCAEEDSEAIRKSLEECGL